MEEELKKLAEENAGLKKTNDYLNAMINEVVTQRNIALNDVAMLKVELVLAKKE